MNINKIVNYWEEPLYQKALINFQEGNWDEGLYQIDCLLDNFPLETELRSLRQGMQLRAKIDGYEVQDRRFVMRRVLRTYTIRLLLIAATVAATFWVVWVYSSWIQERWEAARSSLEVEVQTIELAVKFRNAQNLLVAGRADEAMAMFAEVALEDADFPGLEYYMEQAEVEVDLNTQYNQAVLLIEQGKLDEGLQIFAEIEEVDPNYKDMAVIKGQIEKRYMLEDLFASANKAYADKKWSDALTDFESLRIIDSSYEGQIVEDRLVESYLANAEELLVEPEENEKALQMAEGYFHKALAIRPLDKEALTRRANAIYAYEEKMFWHYVELGRATLAGNSTSLEALSIADQYFLSALALRPNNEQIQLERNLASLYVQAQQDFIAGRWDEVVAALETVVEGDSSYALGTASLTLYEAYMARGESEIVSGMFDLAYEDFQRASVLAEVDGNAGMQSYEAQLKLAKIQGILGNYENAVQIYRAVVEDSNYQFRVIDINPLLSSKIDEAERYARAGNFRMANKLYSEAVAGIDTAYEVVTHVVATGEYLTLIAAKYRSTVNAILSINEIQNPNMIYVGQNLLIPIFDN